jgi:tellurite resistance protein TehA-like permease
MRKAYDLGNFNASLFATEGIASVGLLLAPISVMGCGLVITLGNRLSAGLPSRFVLMSGALLPQILLNVPLTVALLTHGLAILFLLWYVMPRTIFEQDVINR